MVYLIHLQKPFKGTSYYLGFSHDEKVFMRIEHHLKGTGSRYVRAVNLAGIKWKVVRVWPDADGNFEQMLKKHKKTKTHCPICNANAKNKIDEKAAEIIKQLQDRCTRIRKSKKFRSRNPQYG